MNQTVQTFLNFFGLSNILNMASDITVNQFLGLITVTFISFVFSIVMVRCLMEFVKILLQWGRFR